MTRLTPELSRLIRWAKSAPPHETPVMPVGFAGRVAAHWRNHPAPDPLLIWQKAIWASGWAAAGIIGLGLVLLSSQKLSVDSAYDFSSAYQVVATKLVP